MKIKDKYEGGKTPLTDEEAELWEFCPDKETELYIRQRRKKMREWVIKTSETGLTYSVWNPFSPIEAEEYEG